MWLDDTGLLVDVWLNYVVPCMITFYSFYYFGIPGYGLIPEFWVVGLLGESVCSNY